MPMRSARPKRPLRTLSDWDDENMHVGAGFAIWPFWFFDSEWFQSCNVYHRAALIELWSYLCTDSECRHPKFGAYEYGEAIISIGYLASRTHTTENQVRHLRDKLVRAEIMGARRATGGTQAPTHFELIDPRAYFDSVHWRSFSRKRNPSFATGHYTPWHRRYKAFPRGLQRTEEWLAMEPAERATAHAIYMSCFKEDHDEPGIGRIKSGDVVATLGEVAAGSGMGEGAGSSAEARGALESLAKLGLISIALRDDSRLQITWIDYRQRYDTHGVGLSCRDEENGVVGR